MKYFYIAILMIGFVFATNHGALAKDACLCKGEYKNSGKEIFVGLPSGTGRSLDLMCKEDCVKIVKEKIQGEKADKIQAIIGKELTKYCTKVTFRIFGVKADSNGVYAGPDNVTLDGTGKLIPAHCDKGYSPVDGVIKSQYEAFKCEKVAKPSLTCAKDYWFEKTFFGTNKFVCVKEVVSAGTLPSETKPWVIIGTAGSVTYATNDKRGVNAFDPSIVERTCPIGFKLDNDICRDIKPGIIATCE